MEFQSTRDVNKKTYSSAQVIKQGLADDGGLFVPCNIPQLAMTDIEELSMRKYYRRTAKILNRFLNDYTIEELKDDCHDAYDGESFPGGAAPIVKLTDSLYSLELWHGPTAAFKDMALQIMPRLLSRALDKTNEKKTALILVATSGDTGKAALEGYRDIDKIKIMVFYPEHGVSSVQKLQMTTQCGNNVNVCGINGNFDDAQNGVKQIFSDKTVAKALADKGYFLSSANSINWGRLAPQIAYYFSAYCDMYNNGTIKLGEKINVCVPTGNFGNIFAAYIAKMMGLPIKKLICASNSNNVLTDFLHTGIYNRNRDFHMTMSPSMDILISSNLERLLYFVAGSEKTLEYMNSLSKSGKYKIDEETKAALDKSFKGYFADEKMTTETIHKYWTEYNYLIDPHTAVAFSCAEQYITETGDTTKTVITSTASPYKFAKDVLAALSDEKPENDIAALDMLNKLTGVEIPYPLRNIDKRQINFKNVIDSKDMLKSVLAYVDKQ